MNQNTNPNDIKDDEIRIISQSAPASGGASEHKSFGRIAIILMVIGLLLIAGLTALRFFMDADDVEEYEQVEQTIATTPQPAEQEADVPALRPFTMVVDTVVDRVPLTILTPCNATPVLVLGNQAVTDTAAILTVQAADVRADNGEIVGACVINGDVVGRGERKGGFCAIIDGKALIGVAESTPLLEEAISGNGYFFRQYPLVVAGQVVENKPKGRALRKALAELNGRIVVVLSRERLTFHEFSQALVSLGVSTAIYLVGSSAFTAYQTESGYRIESGYRNMESGAMFNYLVWK